VGRVKISLYVGVACVRPRRPLTKLIAKDIRRTCKEYNVSEFVDPAMRPTFRSEEGKEKARHYLGELVFD
jgi:hypothetical protein